MRRTCRKRPGRLLKSLTLLYGALLLLITLNNLLGPEIWWGGSLNLYLPQWIWALPGAILLPWYLLSAPAWSGLPLLALLWVAGPLMGFCWGGIFAHAHSEPGIHLRVMTYNVKWGHRNAGAILEEIARSKPDLILMQDSGGALYDDLRALRQGWNVKTLDQYTLLSRYPLSDPEVRWISPLENHRCARCVLQVGETPITLYDCHLMTPRWGLGSIRHPRSQGVGGLEANVAERLLQATMLAGHLKKERGPLLVAGDFNAPQQSLVCRKLLGAGLKDAYACAGLGYGYTYGQSTKIGRPYMRIDHILLSEDWQVESCRVGTEEGSDHSPVIADLFLPAGR